MSYSSIISSPPTNTGYFICIISTKGAITSGSAPSTLTAIISSAFPLYAPYSSLRKVISCLETEDSVLQKLRINTFTLFPRTTSRSSTALSLFTPVVFSPARPVGNDTGSPKNSSTNNIKTLCVWMCLLNLAEFVNIHFETSEKASQHHVGDAILSDL